MPNRLPKNAIPLKAFVPSVVTVAILMLVLYSQSSPSKWIFYLLYPGLVVSLLITGGHGGTHFEEAIAPVANFLVNTFFYAFLYGILFRAFRQVKERQRARHANPS